MKLVRDPLKALQSVKQANKQVIALKNCKIQIPARYTKKDLATIGIDTYIYGIYALVFDEGFYSVSNVNAMFKISPSKTSNTIIDGVEYIEFFFEPGDAIIENTVIVKQDNLIFNVFDEFVFKGNIPWFLNYKDVALLFDSAREYANSSVGDNSVIIELIASMLARDPEDRSRYYRLSKLSGKVPPSFVGLENVFYSVTNTMNKLTGAYMQDGIVSALVNKTQNVEHIEKLILA